MFRIAALRMCSAAAASSAAKGDTSVAVQSQQETAPTVQVLKDYRQLAQRRKEDKDALEKYEKFKDVPLRYQLLEVLPGSQMPQVKLKYLLACRKHHPEVGGDPEMFLRVSLAYQDCMKDYGIETVDNKVVNLGNYQSCPHELQNYLEARSKITSYIPLSTLDDHIHALEEVQTRLGIDVAEKISSTSDETFWLLEDIEKAVEETGIKTVKLSILEDGSVRIQRKTTEAIESGDKTKQELLEEGTEKQPPSKSAEGSSSTTAKEADHESNRKEGGSEPEGPKAVVETEVSIEDIAVLTAKHNVQKREDVAGIAARVATGVMNNTSEKFQVRLESAVAFFLFANLFFMILAYVDAYFRARRAEQARPEVREHITTDTMLPWWGNDAEYESQVKRIFLDEWRRARSSSRRVQTFQDGVARESMPEATKEKLDVAIFEVTADKLKKMKEHAEAQKGMR